MNRDQHDELKDLGLTAGERDSMERMLTEFRQESNERAEKPELFWAAQRTRIAAKIREPHSQRGLGWLATVAAATALAVFVAVLAHTPTHTTQQAQQVTTTPQSANNVDDEALLEAVNQTNNSSVPDALAPANILASEMDRGLEGASKK